MTTVTSLEDLLPVMADARDWVAVELNKSVELEWDLHIHVGINSLIYGFNTYKTVLMLLPELYYEQATTLFRTLWEVSLNLSWLAQQPEERVELYAGYTLVEYRRLLQSKAARARLQGDPAMAAEFESAAAELSSLGDAQLSRYRRTSGKRARLASRPSVVPLEQVVNELGGQWLHDYHGIYQLACSYSHAGPGATLFPMVIQAVRDEEAIRQPSRRRSFVTGLWSLAALERLYETARQFVPLAIAPFPDTFNNQTSYRRLWSVA